MTPISQKQKLRPGEVGKGVKAPSTAEPVSQVEAFASVRRAWETC